MGHCSYPNMYAHTIRWAAGQTCGNSGWSGADWRNTHPVCQGKVESSAFSVAECVMHIACHQCVVVQRLQQLSQERYLTVKPALCPMFCSLHWCCGTKSGTETLGIYIYEARAIFSQQKVQQQPILSSPPSRPWELTMLLPSVSL